MKLVLTFLLFFPLFGQLVPSAVSVPVGTIVKFNAPTAIMPFFIVGGAGKISREGYYTAPLTLPTNPIVPILMIDLSNGNRAQATVTLIPQSNPFCNTICLNSPEATICVCWDPTRVLLNADTPTVWSTFDALFTKIAP